MFANRVRRTRAARGLLWASIGLLSLSLISLIPATSGSLFGGPGAASGPTSPVAAVHPMLHPHAFATPVPPQVLTSVPVGMEPIMGILDPANGFVYVANFNSENISVLNGTALWATVSLTPNDTGGPIYLAFDPVNGFVYVVDRYNFESANGAVSVINGTQVIATVSVGQLPDAAVVDTASGYVYVTDAGSSQVTILDGTGVLATVPVGAQPWAAAFDSSNGYVYVVNRMSGNVTVLSGTSVIGSINVGIGPDAVAYDPVLSEVYVANNGSGNVSVLSGLAVAATDAVGSNPGFVAVDPRDSQSYVANANSSSLTVLQGAATQGTISVGSDPVWVAFGAAGGFTYAVNSFDNSITVLNGTARVGAVGIGALPTTAVYDLTNGYLYVTNSGSNNVSVVAPAYPVLFNETGLAPGVNWSVTLGVKSNASTGATVGFENLPGVYGYSILPPAGYDLIGSVPSSPVTVTAPGVLVNVTFGPISNGTYGLVFVETGLPIGCQRGGWEPWSWGSGPDPWGWGSWHHHGGCSEPVWSPSPCDSPQGPTAQLATPLWDHCQCGGGGKGGGNGSEGPLVWSVTVGNVTKSSNTSTISFVEPNGTYAYTITGPKGYSVSASVPASPVTIAGSNVTVNVTFVHCQRAAAFTVTFEEDGLPYSTTWCVSLNGSQCSSHRDIVFAGIPAGSYLFNVGNVSGFAAQPSSGTVTVTNQSVVVHIQFSSTHHHCGGW